MLVVGLVGGKRVHLKNSYVATTFKFYVISTIFLYILPFPSAYAGFLHAPRRWYN